MKTIIFFFIISVIFTGCVNKHGISAKYYSDCDEYYDLQGYYHKKCGDDDIVTYKGMKEGADTFVEEVDYFIDYIKGEEDQRKPKVKKNVW